MNIDIGSRSPRRVWSDVLVMNTLISSSEREMGHSNSNSAEKLVRDARAIVADQPHFRGSFYPLSFHCYDRVLVVSGRVPSFYLKQLLQSTLANLDGIDRVINEVDVDYAQLGS
jgi:hypothetical protein